MNWKPATVIICICWMSELHNSFRLERLIIFADLAAEEKAVVGEECERGALVFSGYSIFQALSSSLLDVCLMSQELAISPVRTPVSC